MELSDIEGTKAKDPYAKHIYTTNDLRGIDLKRIQ